MGPFQLCRPFPAPGAPESWSRFRPDFLSAPRTGTRRKFSPGLCPRVPGWCKANPCRIACRPSTVGWARFDFRPGCGCQLSSSVTDRTVGYCHLRTAALVASTVNTRYGHTRYRHNHVTGTEIVYSDFPMPNRLRYRHYYTTL